MLRSIRHSLFLLATGLSLAGCGSLRQEVDPDLLNRESAKLVINGFLSPQDTVLAVKVTRSATVLGDSTTSNMITNVTNATVTISENDRQIGLTYRTAYYQADARRLPIVAGHTYTLVVTTPGGERATGTCTIPPAVPISEITFDSAVSTLPQRFYVRAFWQDPAGQANYYQVNGTYRLVSQCTNCTATAGQPAGTREEVTTVAFDNSGIGLINDMDTDGQRLVSDRAYLRGFTYTGISPRTFFRNLYKMATVTMNLLNAEPGYYQYQSAVMRQAQVRDNPFAEPVLIPSNIQGGLGCFAGYNRSSMTLRLN